MQIKAEIETRVLSLASGAKQAASIQAKTRMEGKSHANFYHGGESSQELRALPLTMAICWS
jgi:hypothetical protein